MTCTYANHYVYLPAESLSFIYKQNTTMDKLFFGLTKKTGKMISTNNKLHITVSCCHDCTITRYRKPQPDAQLCQVHLCEASWHKPTASATYTNALWINPVSIWVLFQYFNNEGSLLYKFVIIIDVKTNDNIYDTYIDNFLDCWN